MRVLVTGGTGFLGSHATRRLRQSGHEVRLLVRTPAKVAPLMEKMGVDADDLDVVQGDITDRDSVEAAIAGCRGVVHAAAVVGTDPTKDEEMERVNLAGVENVLGSAVAAGCDPIVHVSSVAALFPFQTNPVTADHPVIGADNGYGRTKAACERYARALQDDGQPVVVVYPSGIIGPEDWTESIQIANWKTWMTAFPRVKDFSGSWVDVRDLAEIINASMRPGAGPQRLLAMGTHLSADEQIAAISEAIDAPVRSVPLPKPIWWVWGKLGDLARRFDRDLVFTSDAYDYVFNSVPGDDSATAEATGVTPRPVVETFADTIEWLVEAGHVAPEKAGRLAR